MAGMYSAKVMEHFAHPHNVGEIPDANGVGEVGNPKCGDIMRMYLKIENNVIVDVKFLTFGCGAAIATSSMATDLIKGKTVDEALKLTNTMASIISRCCVSPFGFFLGRTYAQSSVPDELLEAARIDGASEARIFFTIVLRLLAPAMVTIFLFLFVATWNNYLLPLMMVSSDTLKPVTLGLYGMVSLATFTDRGALMMGALLGVLPVIVIFLGLQRYWQSGLAAGAVKG